MEPGRTIRDGSVLASAAMRAKYPQPATRGRGAAAAEDAKNFEHLLRIAPELANQELNVESALAAGDRAAAMKAMRLLLIMTNEDNARCQQLPPATREYFATAARRMRQKFEITTR